jgi:hypothetical protein
MFSSANDEVLGWRIVQTSMANCRRHAFDRTEVEGMGSPHVFDPNASTLVS